MTVADTLRTVGRPIAYYPTLAKRLGGVNAAVLFCQIFYWQDKTTSPLGVHKTRDELELETGLTHEEQATARRKLKQCGVLIETTKRIDHKVYFRIDESVLEALLSSDPSETVNHGLGKPGKTVSGNRKSRSGETMKDGSGKPGITVPRNGKSRRREAGDHGFVNEVKTTAETTKKSSSNAREAPPVDNSLPLLLPSNEKPPNREQSLLALLAGLPRSAIDPAKDRVVVLTWVGREIADDQIVEAHRRAVAARERDEDNRPIYAAFLSRFVDEVLAAREAPAATDDEDWWLSASGADEQGARVSVTRRKDEPNPMYLVRVAKASGRGPWIDHCLKYAEGVSSKHYHEVRAYFGDGLLPADDYAS
jgi:hypothetical protein